MKDNISLGTNSATIDSNPDDLEFKQRLDANVEKLRGYLRRYDFKFVLIYLFKHEMELVSDIRNITTDEPLISNYVADIYLTTKAKSLNEPPSQGTIIEIVALIQDIYLLITALNYLSPLTLELGREVKIDNLLVERSLYYDIHADIYLQLFSPISEEFYYSNGFHLEFIFCLHEALLYYMQYRINEHHEGEQLSFDFSMIDIASFFHDEHHKEMCCLIEHLSISSSNNNDLLPRLNNPLHTKPLIKSGNVYFCPNPDSLLRHIKEIVEKFIYENRILRDRYLKNKGKIVENMVVERLVRLMPTANVGKNLKYKIEDIWYELDALFYIDSFVLFVEVKSGNFTPPAREGKSHRLKRDIQDIVLDAHDQCNRVYDYYGASEYVEFVGVDEVIIVSKKEQKNAYMLSITLENLDIITANIQKIVNKDISPSVITMSLYDLSIITDILRGPIEFFLYLDRRQKVVGLGKIRAHDEIDLFSTFISQGLVFDSFEKYDFIDITDFSNSLDIYYFNMLDEKKKPKLLVNPFVLILIEELTQSNKKGWLEVGIALQGLSGETQQLITHNAMLLIKKSRRNGESDFSMLSNDNQIGLTFYSCDKLTDSRRRKIQHYIQTKKHQHKARQWVLLINLLGTTKKITDFQII